MGAPVLSFDAPLGRPSSNSVLLRRARLPCLWASAPDENSATCSTPVEDLCSTGFERDYELPPLQGESGKMSASDENSAIFVSDTPKQIKSKVI